MTFDPTPQPGDVVVRSQRPGATPAFVIRVVPGLDQLGCATRRDTERVARSYAEHAGVDAWYSDPRLGLTRVARCRPPLDQREGPSPVSGLTVPHGGTTTRNANTLPAV